MINQHNFLNIQGNLKMNYLSGVQQICLYDNKNFQIFTGCLIPPAIFFLKKLIWQHDIVFDNLINANNYLAIYMIQPANIIKTPSGQSSSPKDHLLYENR